MSVASAKLGRRRPRYRRRRPLPGLVVLGLLVVLSGYVWTMVFETVETTEAATQCNAPTPPPGAPPQSAPALGEMQPRNGLDRSPLSPPQDVGVRVLNGNGESKQAGLVSDELTSLGFAKGPKADNDPIYRNYDLNCHGQIRYGDSGAGAAHTLSLMAPCSQLVRDERQDGSVDLALGAKFDDIKTTPEAKQILQQLKSSNVQRADGGQQDSQPSVDRNLLAAARDVTC